VEKCFENSESSESHNGSQSLDVGNCGPSIHRSSRVFQFGAPGIGSLELREPLKFWSPEVPKLR
jgi:hypothetical protein